MNEGEPGPKIAEEKKPKSADRSESAQLRLPGMDEQSMSRRLQSDKVLFGTIVALTLFGALMVFSASAVMAAEKFGSSNYFLVRQLAWAGAGFVALVVMMYVDYRRLASPLRGVSGAVLADVAPGGSFVRARSHNTHRWLHLGSASLQPSEFAKIVMVLFLAYFLEQRDGKVNDLSTHCFLWAWSLERRWRWWWWSRTSEPHWPSP